MKRCICGEYPKVLSRITFLSELGGRNAKGTKEFFVKCLNCGRETAGYLENRFVHPEQKAEKDWNKKIETLERSA